MRSVFASTVCADRRSLAAEIVALIVQSDVKYRFIDAESFSAAISRLIGARFYNLFTSFFTICCL